MTKPTPVGVRFMNVLSRVLGQPALGALDITLNRVRRFMHLVQYVFPLLLIVDEHGQGIYFV